MKRILVAPLDWGLGHATRCIPIIRYLLEKKCEVVIGADGRPLELLKKEFPSCEFVQIGGYNISYPERGSMALKIAAQIPKILSGIKREHEQLKKIIKEKKIDAVISDNRFGLWSDSLPCVFITHQLMVKSPFGESWIRQLNKKYILKYTECWVPDQAPPPKSSPSRGGLEGRLRGGLSGDLAQKFPLPKNAKFIGVLSRFHTPLELRSQPSVAPSRGELSASYSLLVILSGPEPQRTVLEGKIIEQLTANPPSRETCVDPFTRGILIVQGITDKNERRQISENVEIVSHLTSGELQREILSSEIILCRPGYSSVMDLAVLGKKAIFVPTPGQTEQEYLGKYFLDNKIAFSVSQKEFDLSAALKESEKYSGFTGKYPGEEFKKAVDSFCETASFRSKHRDSQ